MSLPAAIIDPLVAILVSYMIFADLRASKKWPTTTTIHDAVVGFQGRLSGLPRILHRVHFSHSYSAGGLNYDDRFFLLANDKDAREELRRKLVGKSILVKCDDRGPGAALLVDEELAGKRVMQGPSWTYR